MCVKERPWVVSRPSPSAGLFTRVALLLSCAFLLALVATKLPGVPRDDVWDAGSGH